jgi:hypothetical protein
VIEGVGGLITGSLGGIWVQEGGDVNDGESCHDARVKLKGDGGGRAVGVMARWSDKAVKLAKLGRHRRHIISTNGQFRSNFICAVYSSQES